MVRVFRIFPPPYGPSDSSWERLEGFLGSPGSAQRLEPTVVATHSSKAGWIGRLAGRSLGLPTVFTAHGWAFTEGVPQPSRSLYALMEWLAGAFSSKIITVSEFDRTLARQHGVADDDTIITVHNGLKDIGGTCGGIRPRRSLFASS